MTAFVRHLGGFGLFLLAIVDSSPPTFAGPDILTAIFAARQREPWYYYAAVATAGSILGAWLTFSHGAQGWFGLSQPQVWRAPVAKLLKYFERWGAGALVISTHET